MLKDLPRYRLRKVSIGRFKAVCGEQVVALAPFTVLVGRNGSGKSTLVEALQWIDAALRKDANAACDPYRGIQDLINKQSPQRSFQIGLDWTPDNDGEPQSEDPFVPPDRIGYSIEVGVDKNQAVILNERLLTQTYGVEEGWITTQLVPLGPLGKMRRMRSLYPEQKARRALFESSDRLALPLGPIEADGERAGNPFPVLHCFFRDAVFLRLSPKNLSNPTRTTRSSQDPILDEEGTNLPLLLQELSAEQLAEVVAQLQQVLPDIRGIALSSSGDLALPIHYHVTEELTLSDKSSPRQVRVRIPAWMLSEGTRRLTALFALLARDPPPSLLCIEEIENGLDPWTVVMVLNALRAAVARGVQVLVTTHSPWLLDHAALDEIIRVRRHDGETRYERFTDDGEVSKFRDGVPPGIRYVRGR